MALGEACRGPATAFVRLRRQAAVGVAMLAVAALTSGCGAMAPSARPLPGHKIEGLRGQALRAEPPDEPGEFLPSDLVEPALLDPTLRLDVRYARHDNFLGWPVYPEARVFLQRPAAEAVVRVHRGLREQGYGLMLFDGYRPWYVTKMFWEATPEDRRQFLADPDKGSRHNRGCAVDLTLFDLATGREVPMPSRYDEFTERAHPDYAGGPAERRAARDLLRRAMEAEGFTVYELEWWHFDCAGWQQYRIENRPFKDLS
jgi:D-alanyl-D-alanine dipeptidase